MSPLAIPRRFRRWLSSLPIRWKLAAVTSGLTFIILLAFGFAVGQLTTQQLRDNYAADTRAKATELSQELRERNIITASSAPNTLLAPLLRSVNGTADVILRANGSRYAIATYTLDCGHQALELLRQDPESAPFWMLVDSVDHLAARDARSLSRLLLTATTIEEAAALIEQGKSNLAMDVDEDEEADDGERD